MDIRTFENIFNRRRLQAICEQRGMDPRLAARTTASEFSQRYLDGNQVFDRDNMLRSFKIHMAHAQHSRHLLETRRFEHA